MKPQQNKPAQQQQVRAQQVTHVKSDIYKGPLPKPEDLQHYETIQPGFAERIMKLTEGEAKHRRKIESRVINMNFILTLLGQLFGLASIAGVLYLCYYAFQNNHPTQAAWIACGVLVSVGGVFLWRKNK